MAVAGLLLGPDKEPKCDFGEIFDTEEGLEYEVGGNPNSRELEGGFHGVEGVVVLD